MPECIAQARRAGERRHLFHLLVEMENVGAIGRESRHPAGGCVEMNRR
jgi:hypothetical protein